MSQTNREGSTWQLIQFCVGYFIFYVMTGVLVKYFTGPVTHGFAGLTEMEYLLYSTTGGSLLCLVIALVFKWYKLKSVGAIQFMGVKLPAEVRYIIPSGICTAVVVPTTTLMYMLPISVMVAMVIMRGSVIIVSRVVGAIQIKQGLLKKRVSWEENVAVLFAMAAVATKLFFIDAGANGGADQFAFLSSVPAMSILCSYIFAYGIRIYIMNYYKNTRPSNVPLDNKGFFAIEQIVSTAALVLVTISLTVYARVNVGVSPVLDQLQGAIFSAKPVWFSAILSGLPYGMVAFFSVFLFMFKGRSATFNGLVNRLTSLIAGTTATVLSAFVYGSRLPGKADWCSLLLILVAIAFLTRAETKAKKS